MSDKDEGQLKIRPYARLLTMIGDQLIKNEKIALFELIKNSLDADADWVQVRLVDFGETRDLGGALTGIFVLPKSRIEIEDDGNGMTWDVVSNAWMNPASPIKLMEKIRGNHKSPRKKRVVQGEKGIGRYAAYKIGSNIQIATRSIDKDAREIILTGDFSKYNYETFEKEGKTQFLDEIRYDYKINDTPQVIVEKKVKIQLQTLNRKPHGTLITISHLKQQGLDLDKITEIIDDVNKLNSPFSESDATADFTFDISVNGESLYKPNKFKDRLDDVLKRAPLRITDGKYDLNKGFSFLLNKRSIEVGIDRLKEIPLFRNQFFDSNGQYRRSECGPFSFQFYIFDLNRDAPTKYFLAPNDEDRRFVKEHRIYLYRDGIRVYPYGDPTDDWLNIDIERGTRRAGDLLSNDQVIGHIGITTADNPLLKDKTSREGLLDIGNAQEDFITLIQTLLRYLHGEFQKYRISVKDRQIIETVKNNIIPGEFDVLKDSLKNKIPDAKYREFDDLITKYNSERKYLIEKAEATEDLAAVGMTVEAASHDLMTMIGRAKDTIDFLLRLAKVKDLDKDKLIENVEKLRGVISFIEDQIRGIQPVFRSSRRRKKEFRITDVIGTVSKYYEIMLQENAITLSVEPVGPPLVIKTNEAVLLQTFINLLDNAVHWLCTVDRKERKINIRIDGTKYEVMFSDNGPGISADDEGFIFEPFFTTRGERGRGLGLYIAKQLLERNDFEIKYEKTKKVLPGANFLVTFNPEEDDD